MFFKKLIRTIKQKWLRQTTLTVLLVLLIIIGYVFVNVVALRLKLKPLDFTRDKIYTLSQESKDLIGKVRKNVTIYLLGYLETDKTVDLIRQYTKANDMIKMFIVSTDNRPDLASKYGASTTSAIIAIESNNRYVTIDSTETYTYDYSSLQTIDITEQKVTNAIMDVTLDNEPKIYFLYGQGEFIPSTYIKYFYANVDNAVNEVNTLNLATNNLPEQCDLLVITNPTSDFDSNVTSKIETYINNGGNILWFQNPSLVLGQDAKISKYTNMNKILAMYGVGVGDGIVFDPESSNGVASSNSQTADYLNPSLSYNKIVKDLYTDGNVLMYCPGRITNNEQLQANMSVTVDAFAKSSDESYYMEEIYQGVDLSSVPEDAEKGPFIVGEIATKSISKDVESKLVIFSNAIFITDYTNPLATNESSFLNYGNNKDLALNAVAYLTEREDSIRIRKNAGYVTFDRGTITDEKAKTVIWIIFGVPVLIIIVGIIISIIRRKRR